MPRRHVRQRKRSVAGAILPAVFPSLVHKRAVELGLPQPDVYLVMKTAEPLGESVAAACIRMIGLQSVGGEWNSLRVVIDFT